MGDDDDRRPWLQVTKAGWRVATVAALVLSLSLVAALLAQAGLFEPDPRSEKPDGLTTLALVLAILAFLVQIFVFVFQSAEARRSERRSEELNARAQTALTKIEENSAATQTVLFSQFDRLLDFIVGDRREEVGGRRGDSLEPEEGPAEQEEDAEQPEALSVADVRRMITEAASRPTGRPTFSRRDAMDPDSRAVLDYLRSWPADRAEAEQAVERLRKLSPLALAALVRATTTEMSQRLDRRAVGLTYREGVLAPHIEELVSAGLMRRRGGRSVLTDEARALVRVLPTGKSPENRPPWADEVLEPLRMPPNTQ